MQTKLLALGLLCAFSVYGDTVYTYTNVDWDNDHLGFSVDLPNYITQLPTTVTQFASCDTYSFGMGSTCASATFDRFGTNEIAVLLLIREPGNSFLEPFTIFTGADLTMPGDYINTIGTFEWDQAELQIAGPSNVPEPGTLWLPIVAATLLFAWRGKRKQV